MAQPAGVFFAGLDFDHNELVGSRGKISFATFADEPVLLTTVSGSKEFYLENPPHIQQALIQTIVDQLGGRGSCPSTSTSAARTSRVMDLLLAEYHKS